MTSPQGRVYRFGRFRLDTAERRLMRDGKPVALQPKVFDTLVVLVDHSGHLVDKDRLMQLVWPDTFVEEVNLAVNISTIRKVLGESENGRYIETVPKRGYRFAADVQVGEVDEAPAATAPAALPATPHQVLGRARAGSAPLVWAACALVFGFVAASAYVRSSPPAPAPRTAQPGLSSMAVLPFRLVGESTDGEYFGLGIADDLINKLSGLKQVVIRPTGAIRKYADGEQDPVAAGKALRVDSVLEGNIQKVDGRLRVTVRLVSVPDGRALWSGKFDERLGDVFAVEDSISARVAEAVMPELTGEERRLLARRQGVAPEAHEAYLKGRLFWNKRTAAGMGKAVDHFEQAIRLEPNYALAYAGLADTYTLLYDRSFLPAGQCAPQAKRAAARALELDGTLAEAHASMAYIDWIFDRRGAEAEAEFRRAIALNPNYATAHQWYGRYLVAIGRFDEAIDELKQAQQDDPLSIAINTELGIVLYTSRRYEQAVAQFQKALEMDPDNIQAHWSLGHAYDRQRLYDQAFSEYRQAAELLQGRAFAARIDKTYKTAGYEAGLREIVTELNRQFDQRRSDPGEARASGYPPATLALYIARYLAALGDKEQALVWLTRASAEPRSWVAQLGVDPQFDGLHGDPRFTALIRRAGVADAAP